MQINSAQEYLTRKKRQVIAATFYSTPPEQKNKTNAVYLATVANRASSECTGCSAATGAPGTFQTVNVKDVLSRQALRPIGRVATVAQQ